LIKKKVLLKQFTLNKFIFIFLISCNLSSQELIDFKLINTGTNMTVAILEISDNMVQDGDTLAVFYNLPKNKKACGGFVVWDNGRVALTIWGDDNTTNEKDGFIHQEGFLPIFHIKNGSIRKALKTKLKFGNNFFSHNGISVIEMLD